MEIIAGLHPLVVHFPIALFIVYALFEIFGILLQKEFLLKSAHILLALGVLFSLLAVLTGNQAAIVTEQLKEQIKDFPADLLEEHETYATITLWYFVFLLFLRTYIVLKKNFKGIFRYLFIPLIIIGSFLVYLTGEHGGQLVYKHGLGTATIERNLEKIND